MFYFKDPRPFRAITNAFNKFKKSYTTLTVNYTASGSANELTIWRFRDPLQGKVLLHAGCVGHLLFFTNMEERVAELGTGHFEDENQNEDHNFEMNENTEAEPQIASSSRTPSAASAVSSAAGRKPTYSFSPPICVIRSTTAFLSAWQLT